MTKQVTEWRDPKSGSDIVEYLHSEHKFHESQKFLTLLKLDTCKVYMLHWIWDIISNLDENEVLSCMKARTDTCFWSGKILQKCPRGRKKD